MDSDYPELALNYGDIEFSLLEKIAPQLPFGIEVQFRRDGDALLYPRFGEAVQLFSHCIRNIVTNGKLLVQKADEIIGNLKTLSISIFENDEEAEEQKILLGIFAIKH